MTNLSTLDDTEPPIGALLRAAHEIVYGNVYKRTAAAGHPDLHPAHFRLLQFPGVDGVRPTELARSLDTSKQAINPLLGDLEQWGYITREPDHHDGRGRIIHLTDRGVDLMRTIRSIHAEVETSWIAQLGHRKFAALRESLDQIAKHQARPPTR
jgi:DNA-binding MarR family transcriptional regulator